MPQLHLSKAELVRQVAFFLGWGRTDEGSLSADRANHVNDVLLAGLRQFYFPVLPTGGIYVWSFLQPWRTLTLTSAGAGTYALPDDFAGLMGNLTYTVQTSYPPIIQVGEARIRELRQANPALVGRPQFCAVRPMALADATGPTQLFKLEVYPKPDANYEVQYRSTLLPEAFVTQQFPYGGAAHAETIVASCLAVAEQRFDGAPGLHTARFKELLAASLGADMALQTPDYFGRLRDPSNAERQATRQRDGDVLFNGVLYPT